MPIDMSAADELRLIADSIQMMSPFQAARLSVIANRVESLESGLASRHAPAATKVDGARTAAK